MRAELTFGRAKDLRPAFTTAGASENAAWFIRAMIFSGELGPGDRLPPGRDLAARLGISIVTLRVALKSLEAAGYIVTSRGARQRIVKRDVPAQHRRTRLDEQGVRVLDGLELLGRASFGGEPRDPDLDRVAQLADLVDLLGPVTHPGTPTAAQRLAVADARPAARASACDDIAGRLQ